MQPQQPSTQEVATSLSLDRNKFSQRIVVCASANVSEALRFFEMPNDAVSPLWETQILQSSLLEVALQKNDDSKIGTVIVAYCRHE